MQEEDIAISDKSRIESITEFNSWAYNIIRPFLRGRMLEIESGDNTCSSLLLDQGIPVHLNHPDEKIHEYLKVKYALVTHAKIIHSYDFHNDILSKSRPMAENAFDIVFGLNAFFDKSPESNILSNISYVLRTTGFLIVVLPVTTTLYQQGHQDPGYWQRHNRKRFKLILGKLFPIIEVRYFNFNQPANAQNKIPVSGLSAIIIAQKK